jgi:4-amino-4-deoxy-L-arabinose transferase-like glycosyltransferase
MHGMAEKNHLWQSPIVIALVALALRLGALPFFYHSTYNNYENHLLFGFETGRVARSIAEGHGFGNPLYVQTGPTAWLTPVYPYLLAGVFKLFGVYTKTSALVILGLNALFSALVCFLLFGMAQGTFGRSVAVTACWIWTLYPYFIYIPTGFVWDTCLGALLVATLFLCALKLREQPGSWWSWLGFGALGGFAALTNASTLTLCPILAAWAIYPLWQHRKRWLSPATLVVAGLLLALLPWQIRNYRTFHTHIPLRDVFWLEFWIGNNGNTSSWMDTDIHPSTNAEERAAFIRLGEIPYMREKRREALAFLAQHPGLYFVQCLRRFVYLWTGFWNLDPSNLQDEFHGFANIYLTLSLTIAMLLGLWPALRNSSVPGEGASSVLHSSREAVLPYLLVLSFYPLVFYLAAPAIRYRHVIDPEVVVLAAVGVKFLLSKPVSPAEQPPAQTL